MQIRSDSPFRWGWALLCCIYLQTSAWAGPWVEAGNTVLRHDLQMLSDAGYLNIPLASWPLAWSDIDGNLPESLDIPPDKADLQAALQRVRRQLDREAEAHRMRTDVMLAADSQPLQFRTFTDTPREKLQAGAGVAYMGDWFAVRVQGQAVSDPADGREFRADGSYLGVKLGNWALRADTLDRWWGPGWEGSLILSNNARPFPAITLQRERSDAFSWRPLAWLGPWQFTTMLGQLEGNRDVPHAKMFGMRLSFKPYSKLEIGLSRTAQWGGDGRPEDLKTIGRLLIGQDNYGNNDVTVENQPGNQMAGYDVRWASPLLDLPYALYAQFIGEDEAGGLPSRFIGLIGAEIWGQAGRDGQSYRMHLEYSDTASEALTNSQPRFDYAYAHHVYFSGYRYYDRSIGHSIDSDAQSLSLGALWVQADGDTWEGLLRRIRTDRNSAGSRDLSNLELRHVLNRGDNVFQLGSGLLYERIRGTGENSTDAHVSVQWQREF